MEEQSANTNLDSDFNDVVPVYANNVRFDMSAWDLRVLFGQLTPAAVGRGQDIDWHTDVTIPWPQAKLMYLYLGINIALYEADNGMIKLPIGVVPQPLATTPSDVDPQNPQSVAAFELVQTMIKAFRDAQLANR